MLEKPYRLHGDNYFDLPCVIKVEYTVNKLTKYVVVKCKNQAVTLKTIENGLNAFLRGGANSVHGIFFFLNEHVKNHPGGVFKVKTISKPEDSPYKLLQIEQIELDKGQSDSNMLNNQRDAYIPMYNDETMAYGWISPVAVLNFNNWVKKRKKAARAAKKSVQ